VMCADAGKYFVYDTDAGGGRRDIAAHLGQDDQKSDLPDIGRFAGHVGSGQNDQMIFLRIKISVVRYKGLSERLGHDRMTAVPDVHALGYHAVDPGYRYSRL